MQCLAFVTAIEYEEPSSVKCCRRNNVPAMCIGFCIPYKPKTGMFSSFSCDRFDFVVKDCMKGENIYCSEVSLSVQHYKFAIVIYAY